MNLVEDLNERSLELEAANEKLKDLDRLKSLFIASMSHELRTPLNSIIGFSSILINEWAGPLTSEQKENLSSVLRAGKHLLALINDVIDVTKIEAGKTEVFVDHFNLYDLITEVLALVASDIQHKGLELTIRADHDILHTDRRRLLQCLLNLVNNALKFTEKGSIRVETSRSGDRRTVEIAVIDSGIGVCDEDLGKLFSPFVRLDSPLRSKVLGTGLGLYLTKKLTQEVLKGEVEVTSTLGKGSRFVLRVPVSI
jgi:signal transduction histidine kinase